MTTPKPTHRKFEDIEGLRYCRLIVVGYLGRRGHDHLWSCLCDCGGASDVLGSNLKRGNTTSCGCLHREITAACHVTHGHYGSPEWRTWAAMKCRCVSNHAIAHKHYGSKGIVVCDRWRESFESFLADMGPKPSPQYTIERIINSLGYEPGNCRWATRADQSRNTSRNRRLMFGNRTVILADLARLAGTSHKTISDRLGRGLTVEQAMAASGVYPE